MQFHCFQHSKSSVVSLGQLVRVFSQVAEDGFIKTILLLLLKEKNGEESGIKTKTSSKSEL